MIRFFRVDGCSMQPTLDDGDYVITSSWLLQPKRDRLVVVDHNSLGIIVKRVADITAEGFILRSDNQQGTDSLTIGLVPPEKILGIVLFTIRRKRK